MHTCQNGIWHPCTQMKDQAAYPPHHIKSASGSYLILKDGRTLIDASSSWWCKSLGHNHPILKAALIKQIDQFEHTIFANTTYDNIIELTNKLTQIDPTLNKVFYTGDGSCAVEVALKMSIHLRSLQNEQRPHILSLSNGYHGETIMTLAVSDVGLYKSPYQTVLPNINYVIQDIPYVSSRKDPLWNNCDTHWQMIEPKLEAYRKSATAIIIEPVLQGAGGMKIYSPQLIRHLRKWCDQNNVHLIADEIMTGVGRTGKMFACEHADITPDILCLSKGLTSGWLAFSAVLTKESIYQAFYHDEYNSKTFLHSNTYCGNPLGAAVANACLDVIQSEAYCQRAMQLETTLMQYMQQISDATGHLHNIRALGAMVAADLKNIPDHIQRAGFQVAHKAAEYGALLRPLGNTIYWLPPLNIPFATLKELQAYTQKAIMAVLTTNSSRIKAKQDTPIQ